MFLFSYFNIHTCLVIHVIISNFLLFNDLIIPEKPMVYNLFRTSPFYSYYVISILCPLICVGQGFTFNTFLTMTAQLFLFLSMYITMMPALLFKMFSPLVL